MRPFADLLEKISRYLPAGIPCLPISIEDQLPYPTQATDTDNSDANETPITIFSDNPGTSDQVSNLPAHSNLFHNHRHMNYCDISARHETFRNWPHPSTQDPVCMVEYGFFYTGKGDLVRCYSCDIGLKDWGEGDDPLLEHIKHSENCKHIEFNFDSTLVEQYKSRLRGSSSGNQNVHRHPEYQHVDTRLSSFARWPRSLRPSHEVAAAGFFYTGLQDLVRCFHCDGGLRSWDPNDDPWVEHARWFPDCDFVIQTKGEQFVQNVQAAVQGSDPEEEEISNQMGGMRLYGPIGIGLKDWGEGDDPLLEHIKHSEKRKHLEFTLDSTLVEQYKSLVCDQKFAAEVTTGQRNFVKYPKYQQADARLASFTSWPGQILSAQMLADAGFFYTGCQDQVRCFYCGGGLRCLDQNDDPWIEHARWFRNCDFIKCTRGDRFIQNVQAARQQLDTEKVTYHHTSNTRLHDPADQRKLKKESDHPIYTRDAQAVVRLGYSSNAVRMTIDECIAKKKHWNTDVLIEILKDKEKQGIPLPIDSPRSESPVLMLQDNDSSDESVFKTNKRLMHCIKCIQCEDEDANVVFLPCGHHRMCSWCARDVTMCPMCGKTVKEQIKTRRALTKEDEM